MFDEGYETLAQDLEAAGLGDREPIETTQSKLDRLADMQAHVDVIKANAKTAREMAIPLEVLKQLEEIDRVAYEESEKIQAEIAALENEIKTVVLLDGSSVKGKFIHAVYNKGRVSWDGKLLDGMAKLIPQLEAARKVGEPTVSLRRL
jgi:hypothetical protein